MSNNSCGPQTGRLFQMPQAWPQLGLILPLSFSMFCCKTTTRNQGQAALSSGEQSHWKKGLLK